ncbi:MAG: cobalt ECF transporter T component CbiQ [Candidatus Saccharibacteria bacterium]
MELPDWITADNDIPARHSGFWDGRGTGFISRSIREMNQVISEALISERFAAEKGLWQLLDARVKLVTVLLLVILAGITKDLRLLVGLWLFTLILMAFSRLPVLKLQPRIWGIIPLITLIVSIPGMLNIFTDGAPLLVVHRFTQSPNLWGWQLSDQIFLTKQGVRAAAFLVLRVGVSLSLGVLLTMTTPAAILLKSLRALKVPVFFVMILEMCYRYLMLLVNTSLEMFEARKMRTIGGITLAQRRALVGSSVAALFAKSMATADEVYLAMTARCYTGEAVSISENKMRMIDWLWADAMLIMMAIVIGGMYAAR